MYAIAQSLLSLRKVSQCTQSRKDLDQALFWWSH